MFGYPVTRIGHVQVMLPCDQTLTCTTDGQIVWLSNIFALSVPDEGYLFQKLVVRTKLYFYF